VPVWWFRSPGEEYNFLTWMLLRKTVRFGRGVENTDVRRLRFHGELIGG
jgi:hypothetical protein